MFRIISPDNDLWGLPLYPKSPTFKLVFKLLLHPLNLMLLVNLMRLELIGENMVNQNSQIINIFHF